jgi:diaminohydroxyphosphoribosylaminopyrimidine deaminase/5-amino-6-(5-phosphoribosylamino)uracil reductase
MLRCIQLAKNGLGTTYPNPMVGSVVVYEDRIIGEGWHFKAGQPHAEVNAIANVTDTSLLKNATIYVSLEPCSHFGKTPPCADLIVKHGIKKVVIGSTDPNPKVAGAGIVILKKAGCDVITGVLEKECRQLNKRFFTFHLKKRPFIVLKWAQTANGFIAPFASERTKKEPVWITNETSRTAVHKMRAAESSILVGTKTVLADNPSLTVRDWEGSSPLRVVIDRELKIPEDANVFSSDAKTLVITEKEKLDTEKIQYKQMSFSEELPKQIASVLFHSNIHSVLIEGGRKTLQSFIDADLWDEAFVYTGITEFNDGILAPAFSGDLLSEEKIGLDSVQHFKNTSL